MRNVYRSYIWRIDNTLFPGYFPQNPFLKDESHFPTEPLSYSCRLALPYQMIQTLHPGPHPPTIWNFVSPLVEDICAKLYRMVSDPGLWQIGSGIVRFCPGPLSKFPTPKSLPLSPLLSRHAPTLPSSRTITIYKFFTPPSEHVTIFPLCRDSKYDPTTKYRRDSPIVFYPCVSFLVREVRLTLPRKLS